MVSESTPGPYRELVSRYPTQRGQELPEFLQQICQARNLSDRVGLLHVLESRIEPVWVAAQIDEFDTHAARVVTPDMMCDAVHRNPFFDSARTFYIVMS